MIEAIFFDFYDTMARFDPPRDKLQAAACADFGMRVTKEGIDRGYSEADALMARENALLPLRKRTPEAREEFFAEYERLVLKGAGLQVSREQASQVWQRVRQMRYDVALFDDVLPALHVLKEQGLTLGVISNLNRDMGDLVRRLKLSPYVDFSVTSGEVGAEKPHAPIFLAALEKAEVEPPRAIHVGDQLDSDVKGARAVGINPVLIDRYGSQVEYRECPRIESMMEVQGLLADYLWGELDR